MEAPGILGDARGTFVAATAAIVGAECVAGVMGASPAEATGCAAVVTVLMCTVLPFRWGFAVAGVGWAFVTGFFVNSFGTLTFNESDAIRLAVLIALGPGLGTLARHRV